VQLLQTGIAPAPHPLAEGTVVGLDIGPSTIAVVGDGSASLVKFCDNVIQPWTETRRLQRKMDRSKRATNLNVNGTAKRGAEIVAV
jgi:transposase